MDRQKRTTRIVIALVSVFFVFLIITLTATIEHDESKTTRGIGDSAAATGPKDDITIKKEKLLKYLHDVPDNKTLSGMFVELKGSNRYKGVNSIPNIAGVYPAVLGKIMPPYTASVTQWNDFINEVISDWRNGSLVRIVWYWEEDHPLRDMRVFQASRDYSDNEFRWNELIKEGGDLDRIWKGKLDLLATYLLQLQTAGVITLLDILPYINSPEYIWRGRPGVNGTAKLYQITHDYLKKEHKLSSLIWIWSLDTRYMNRLPDFYPGDDYVDVASVYVWDNNNRLPISNYRNLLSVVGNKPISIENIFTVPTRQVLAEQPRWTWFTVRADCIDNYRWNINYTVRATFNSTSVINRGSIDFFND